MHMNQTGLLLVFERVLEEDVGNYYCTASGKDGRPHSISIKLTVTSEFSPFDLLVFQPINHDCAAVFTVYTYSKQSASDDDGDKTCLNTYTYYVYTYCVICMYIEIRVDVYIVCGVHIRTRRACSTRVYRVSG